MTEPENFDDDLFADLYNDDDPNSKAAAVPDSAPAIPVAVAPTSFDTNEEVEYHPGQNGGADSQMHEEYDEDDDDVDFNLGNASTSHQADTPSYSTPAPAPMTKGPNSKEDG